MRRVAASGLTVVISALFVWKSVASGEAARAAVFVLPNLLSHGVVALMLGLSMLNRPKRVDDGWFMFVLCVGTANLFLLLSLAGVRLFSAHPFLPLQVAGGVGILALVPFYVVAVLTLGRNLTVLPEANSLTTHGVYAFSRHPLYAIYIVWYSLQVLLCQSAVILALAVLQIALQVVRARHEERVLESAFPEYAAYRARVGWFGPRLRRREVAAEVPAASPVSVS